MINPAVAEFDNSAAHAWLSSSVVELGELRPPKSWPLPTPSDDLQDTAPSHEDMQQLLGEVVAGKRYDHSTIEGKATFP
jgi:hypothetical protein